MPDWQLQWRTNHADVSVQGFSRRDQVRGQPSPSLAEQAWHHPDIDIRWNKVTLTLTTHDAGGLTEKDFALARQFDKL